MFSFSAYDCVLNLLLFPGELVPVMPPLYALVRLASLAVSPSLHVLLPARRVSAGSYCPQLICYRD